MLKFYHAPGTRAFRAMWVCEELGVPYEIQPVDFSVEYRKTPEWRAMHPVGKVPVMDDGDMRMHARPGIARIGFRHESGFETMARDNPPHQALEHQRDICGRSRRPHMQHQRYGHHRQEN